MTVDEDGVFPDGLRLSPMPLGFDPGAFDCGESDLTAYLCDGDACRDEAVGFARTYLVYGGDDSIGYVSVMADAIRLEAKERPDGVEYSSAPALKLGRMGLDKSHHGRGIGIWMLDMVVGMARTMGAKAGLRYVTLDALNDGLVAWYSDYGFVRNHGEANRQIALLKSFGSWKKDSRLHRTSMRFDIQLEEEAQAC